MKPQPDKIRLSKLMSLRNICSRREADKLIEKKLVLVDGVIISELGTKVSTLSKIKLLSEAQEQLNSAITLALHKPRNFVSSQPEKNYKSALELIQKKNYHGPHCKSFIKKGLAPLGRLDIDSTGLIIYSQNGTFAKKIIGHNTSIEKEYEVNVKGLLTPKKIKTLQEGLHLDGEKLKAAKVYKKNDHFFHIVLKQGKKRQIRRMCELLDLHVTRIHRIRVGAYNLGTLPLGKWTFITPEQVLK